MKIPAPLFVVINLVMIFLLRSPLHFFWSKSIMLITFTGRKSGRQYTTPVRYMREGGAVLCSTEKKNLWWRNLSDGAYVVLRTDGEDARYVAKSVADDSDTVKAYLERCLLAFPQDAPYVGVRMDKNKVPVPEDLENAAHETVLIEATPAHRS